MDSVFRAAFTYFFVWLILRAAGRRTLSEMTTFDLILLLIISETTQAALLDNDNSVMNSVVLIATLVGIDVALSYCKQWFERVEKVLDGVPLIILENGVPLRDRMAQSRVDDADMLASARQTHGLERLDQIKYAVLEKNGIITVIPKPRATGQEG